jgi:DNA-directed RNA polymerase subunit RPC12/RpoP
VNVVFACPECETPARKDLGGPLEWSCVACGQRLTLMPDVTLSACAICGNHELYKKKDFPHWLGMSILVIACAASVITYGWYEKWLTWAILIGSALFDGLLYLCVGDAVVCYRCHAHYRGVPAAQRHKPFELTIGERYRQERLRREQLKQAARTANPS